MTETRSHVLYAYISKPTTEQITSFIHALESYGISISHLGKNDPPGRFRGSINEAVALVFSGKDLTDSTFMRDANRKLECDIAIHHDPRWTHSTISASCPDPDLLKLVANGTAAACKLFISIRGRSGLGKEQPWEIVHINDDCPRELRDSFVTT